MRRFGQTAGGQAGFLYVIRFDTGVVKAGRTNDVGRRRGEHTRAAARFGVRLAEVWTSVLVEDADRAERRLLGVLQGVGRRTDAGREYFRGVPFAVARYQAEIVVGQRTVHRSRDGLCDTDKVMRLVAVVESGPASAEYVEFSAVLRLQGGDRIRAQLHDPDLGPDGRYPLRSGDEVQIDLEKGGTDSWNVWGVHPQGCDCACRLV
ncbi:GIY-YIG nuclease family protein [Polymorphospora rubra]|uniref:GIY-YIG nuclease family protein n=1 Tax=Polymorphospora rubra TaxID=338584 RepID=UPI0033FA7DB5